MKWAYEVRRNREGKIAGETYEYKSGMLKASIVKGHIYYPDGFVLHCPLFRIDTHALKSDTFEKAIIESEKILRKEVKKLQADLRDFI